MTQDAPRPSAGIASEVLAPARPGRRLPAGTGPTDHPHGFDGGVPFCGVGQAMPDACHGVRAAVPGHCGRRHAVCPVEQAGAPAEQIRREFSAPWWRSTAATPRTPSTTTRSR